MPTVRLTATTHLALMGIAFGGALFASASPAAASDLEVPYRTYERRESYRPPPPPDPVYVERRYVPPPPRRVEVEVDETACRIITRRRIDDWGREVVRRIRVCDDGVVERRPYGPPPPRYAEDYRRYDDRRYDAPRPPRVVGPQFDDEWDE